MSSPGGVGDGPTDAIARADKKASNAVNRMIKILFRHHRVGCERKIIGMSPRERKVLSVRVKLLFFLHLQYLQLSMCGTPGSIERGHHARGTDRRLVFEKDR